MKKKALMVFVVFTVALFFCLTSYGNEISVIINGNNIDFDVPPQNINGRVLVPLRAIFEAMGAEIEWDDETQTVTAEKDGTVVILTIGSNSPTVNGRVVPLDQPAVILNGRILAPLRFVAEAFGGTVEWDGTTQTAMIHTGLENTSAYARLGLEIVNIDGEDVFRFTQTRGITVEAWNRGDDRMPHISQSIWADWIKAEMLRLHNIDVTFVEVPRWEEVDTITNLLSIGTAPDISYTFEEPLIEAAAAVGLTTDLAPLVNGYAEIFPHFYNLQGADNIWWSRNEQTGELSSFKIRHFGSNQRIGTFVRGDWLDTLGIQPPATLREFEDMLKAFRDNAELLLGADAERMIPYRLTSDVGWTGEHVISSFIPSDITDREWFIYGFDDRRFMNPGTREGARVLNRWYNDGLIWQDFHMHKHTDSVYISDDYIMMGYVGAFSGNWDYPFRPRPGIIANLQRYTDENAYFIPIAPFENDAGERIIYVSHGTDRTVFFPSTNTEPLASLLYLDFLSRPDVYEFLMFGYEGIHYSVENGVYSQHSMDNVPYAYVIPSLRNYDLLPVFNGAPPLNTPGFASFFYYFDSVDPRIVADAVNISINHARTRPLTAVNRVGSVNIMGHFEMAQGTAFSGVDSFGNAVLTNAITASPADFDDVFDTGTAQYLNAGGQLIIEERAAAWYATYGDLDWLP